ncbi:hypothetical protein NQZ68_004479 [Dissostichus eleginoides]|nr:hypothetical protein NQZ68_004479 [Dissostichus eleginoides]
MGRMWSPANSVLMAAPLSSCLHPILSPLCTSHRASLSPRAHLARLTSVSDPRLPLTPESKQLLPLFCRLEGILYSIKDPLLVNLSARNPITHAGDYQVQLGGRTASCLLLLIGSPVSSGLTTEKDGCGGAGRILRE